MKTIVETHTEIFGGNFESKFKQAQDGVCKTEKVPGEAKKNK